MNHLYVIGDAGGDPWVLNLGGYVSLAAAKRAIYWQHQPRQEHDDAYWRIAELRDGKLVDYDTSKIYHPTHSPYTEDVWAAFVERTGL